MLRQLHALFQLPSTIGQKTSADSLSVVFASDSTGFPTTPGTTATGSNQGTGRVAGSALTGSYATVYTATFDVKWIALLNSCDDVIVVSLDSGTTAFVTLDVGKSLDVPLASLGLKIASGVTIQAKHNGAAPTAGALTVSVIG